MNLIILLILSFSLLLSGCHKIVSKHPIPQKGKILKKIPSDWEGNYALSNGKMKHYEEWFQVEEEWLQVALPTPRKCVFSGYQRGYGPQRGFANIIEEKWVLDLKKSTFTNHLKSGEKIELPLVLKKKGNYYFFNIQGEDYWFFVILEEIGFEKYRFSISTCKPSFFKEFENKLNSITEFKQIENYESEEVFIIDPTDEEIQELLDLADFFDTYTLTRMSNK